MKLKSRAMLQVVDEIERYGKAELFAYLIAFSEAKKVMGPEFGKPLGERSARDHNALLLGIGIAAHYLNEAPC